MIIVLLIFTSFLISSWIGGLLYIISNGTIYNKFYHDILKWHIPDDNKLQDFDGCNTHTYCKFCGKEIIQDSQGNWF